MANVFYTLLFLGLMIFVHELGHFMAARLTGIYVNEFAIGFGPAILKWKRKGTDFSLRILPIGGYVKFLGEFEDENDPRALSKQKLWKRFIAYFAGPFMNFVLAIVLMIVLFVMSGSSTMPMIGEVFPSSPAEKAGFEVGDKIISIDSKRVLYSPSGTQKAVEIVTSAKGNELKVEVIRNNEKVQIKVTPEYIEEEEKYMLGISFARVEFTFMEAVKVSFVESLAITDQMLGMLRKLFFKGEGIENVGGPVTIYKAISYSIKEGITQLMWTGIIISLNLGIINLLPIPVLDGGRLLLLLVEGARGKPLAREKENILYVISFGLLILLMIAVTFKDIFFPVVFQ